MAVFPTQLWVCVLHRVSTVHKLLFFLVAPLPLPTPLVVGWCVVLCVFVGCVGFCSFCPKTHPGFCLEVLLTFLTYMYSHDGDTRLFRVHQDWEFKQRQGKGSFSLEYPSFLHKVPCMQFRKKAGKVVCNGCYSRPYQPVRATTMAKEDLFTREEVAGHPQVHIL